MIMYIYIYIIALDIWSLISMMRIAVDLYVPIGWNHVESIIES